MTNSNVSPKLKGAPPDRHIPMDRAKAFQELYALMALRRTIGDQIGSLICEMKNRGIEDAPLIKAVIDESLVSDEIRNNTEANERRKDAIYAEFFGGDQ